VLRAAGQRSVVPLVAAAVFVIAVGARLVPVLRGGGLSGEGNYDDAVHYTAAAGLVNGRMPYADFLFLHPPGIVVALTPFAAFGALTSDGMGMAAARLVWMLLGGLNAALVVLILRRIGLAAAISGGLFYAWYFPAVYDEHTTLLEALCNAGLLCAILIGQFADPVARWSTRRDLAAGLVVGAAASVKVWVVVPVLVLVCWLLITAGWRRASIFLGASLVGCSLVCLPFFLNAPVAMWQMVVIDQLGRPRKTSLELSRRLYDVAGLRDPLRVEWLLLILVGIGALLVIAAWASRDSRLFVALLGAGLVVLALVPVWWVHYASFVAVPAALTLGAGISRVHHWVSARSRRVSYAVTSLLAVVGMASLGVPVLRTTLGAPFPAGQLEAPVAASAGCVTTDDPIALIQTDVLTRNLQRGCRIMVDIRGYAFDRYSPAWAPDGRRRSPGWQANTLNYIRSGDVYIQAHFSAALGFDKATAAAVRSWPVLAKVGHYVVRKPNP
jgi:alpha-1,2-mannosyltransferase